MARELSSELLRTQLSAHRKLGTSRRYPKELRGAAVQWLRRSGMSCSDGAKALGLCPETLAAWTAPCMDRGAFQAVRVQEIASSLQVRGFSVDGLSVTDAMNLVERVLSCGSPPS